MLHSWQIFLLDASPWLLPLLILGALIVFPWKHWNYLLGE